MTDIENIVFTRLAQAVRAAFPHAVVSGEYVEVPAAFPFVSCEEKNNSVLENRRDLNGIEHYSELMYEINVYTNNGAVKKSAAKAIAAVCDDAMAEMQFTRIFKNPIPNIDRSVYRILMRYRAVVREGREIDGKTVCQMHTTGGGR